MKRQWHGSENSDDLTGVGVFGDKIAIQFERFHDFHLLCGFIDQEIARAETRGREEVLGVVQRHVKGK